MFAESQKLCLVCGDKSIGVHYRVECCDGCRRFFKRATETGIGCIYRCRFSNSCVINVISRHTCRRCRLRKCYKIGMSIPFVYTTMYPRIVAMEPKEADLEEEAYVAFFGKESVLLLERPLEPGQAFRYVRTMKDVVDALDAFQYHLTKWADRTSLLQSLGDCDKGALLRANILQRFIVDILFRSQGRPVIDLGTALIYSPEAPDPPIDDSVTHLFKCMREVLDQVNELGVTERELGFLRLLSFLNHQAEGLKDEESVQLLGKHFTNMLRFEESDIYPNEYRDRTVLKILRSTGVIAQELQNACRDEGRMRLFQIIERTFFDAISNEEDSA